MLNPNSVVNVREVVDTIKMEFDVGDGPGQRRWLVVCMDGAPYHHLRKIQADHAPLYDWVVPEIGLGHCEILLKKTFLQLNWEAMFKKVADLLGFESPRAQSYAQSCGDNHKTWDFMFITYHALLAELAAATSSPDETPSFKELLSRCKSSLNPSVQYWGEQLWYLHNIITFRGGASLPESVRADYDPCASVSLRGNPTAGEGLDFILEMWNKDAKKFMTGDVSPTQWQRTFRMMPDFREWRSTYMGFLGVVDTKDESSRRVPCMYNEVSVIRAMIRQSGALSADNTTLRGFTTAELPLSLLQIKAQGQSNLRQHVANMCAHPDHRLSNLSLKFLYSSEQEENVLKTTQATKKADLIDILVPSKLEALRAAGNLLEYDQMYAEWQNVKLGNKRMIVDFFVKFDSKIVAPL